MKTAEGGEPTYERLRDAAVSGVRWSLLARGIGETSQLVATVALARLLAPAEFGHAAIALILVPLSTIVTFEGFASALVQRKQINRRHVETATLASIVAGVALSGLTYLAALLIAPPLFGEKTSHLVQLASPLFLIAGMSAVSRSLLWRELKFRQISLVEAATLALGAAAAVGLAAKGLGGEALVLGAIVTAIASTVAMIAIVPLRRPGWHRQELREVLSFGGPASGAGLLSVAIMNVDYTILAARLSAAQVGYYWRSFQLGVVYQDKLSGIMMRLAFPLYSRTKDVKEMQRLHERATRVHAATVVPLLAIFIAIAPVLIPWLFGPRWDASILPAQILAVAGMIAAVLTGFPQVLLAAGRSKPLMRFNIVLLLVYGGAVLATASYGIVAVAVAVVCVYIAKLLTVYSVLFARVVGIPVGEMFGDLAPAGTGSVALLAICLPLVELLRTAGLPAPLIVLAVGVVGLAVHCSVLRLAFPAVWHDLSTLVRRVVPLRFPQRIGSTPAQAVSAPR